MKLMNIFLVIFISEFVQSQTSTLNSVSKALKTIHQNLAESQNNVMMEVLQAQFDLTFTISTLKSIKGTSKAVKEAISMRELLNTIASIFNFYESDQIVFSCSDATTQIRLISYDINKCKKVQIAIELNKENFTTKARKIYSAVISSNSKNPTEIAQSNVETTISKLDDVSAKMSEFQDVAIEQIKQFEEIQKLLLEFDKKNCLCTRKTQTIKKQAMENVENKLKIIKANIETRETKIRKNSLENSYRIEACKLIIQKNSSLEFLVTNLDFLRDFLMKMSNLTTSSSIKSALTCDDAEETISFIYTNFDAYFRADQEVHDNISLVFFYLSSLNNYYKENLSSFKISLKRSIEVTISAMFSYGEEFRQLVMALASSRAKLDQIMKETLSIRNENCNCEIPKETKMLRTTTKQTSSSTKQVTRKLLQTTAKLETKNSEIIYTSEDLKNPNFTCTPSKSFKLYCNTCVCAADGKRASYCGRVGCNMKLYTTSSTTVS
jgi:hypothetical protein